MAIPGARTVLRVEGEPKHMSDLVNPNDGHGHANICIDCTKATGGCEWSKHLKPVSGWTAELVYYSNGVTYYITGCPKFVKEPKRTCSIRGELSPEDEKLFLENPVAYINSHSKSELLDKLAKNPIPIQPPKTVKRTTPKRKRGRPRNERS